jgi:hypothetical protein
MNFQHGYVYVFSNLSLIPLKKGILWKVTQDNTIDIENEEIFSSARLRLKSQNLRLCIKKRNIMHLPKRRRVRAKIN